MRIVIDQDDTLAAFSKLWYDMHNEEYGHIHLLAGGDSWEDGSRCKDNNCPADIFKYFKTQRVWTDPIPIRDSINITRGWVRDDYDLAILTKAVNAESLSHKADWLEKYFPHIPNIMMILGNNIKYWVNADIMIDDGIHNHIGFQGISILFDRPWNRRDKILIRANDWQHVDRIVVRADQLISKYQTSHNPQHKAIERMLKNEIDKGLL